MGIKGNLVMHRKLTNLEKRIGFESRCYYLDVILQFPHVACCMLHVRMLQLKLKSDKVQKYMFQ
jgi:hypothetical protein